MHTLITGMTESGKTTLARITAVGLIRKKKQVWVLDPCDDDQWADGCRVFNDIETFLPAVRSKTDLFLFVDESGYSLDRYEPEHNWLATTSRHQGHSVTFIGQRFTQLAPIIRTNCSQCYMFAQPRKDIEAVAEEFNEDSLLEAPKLQQFEFVRLGRFSPPLHGRVRWQNMKVYIDKK